MRAGSQGEHTCGGVKTGVVRITFFTNPLCCWSWAFEPQWRRLRYEYGGQIAWRYRMTDLPPRQEATLIHGDADRVMRRLWSAMRQVSGMPINPELWFIDPPDSALPACLAFKAVEQQSPVAADQYLRLLRQAALLEFRNIARREVLIQLADELSRDAGDAFDTEHFRRDLDAPRVFSALQSDRREARSVGFGHSPGLFMQRADQRFNLMAAPCAYATLQEHLRLLAPDLRPLRQALDAEAYAAYWGRITGREIAEAVPSDSGPAPNPAPAHIRRLSRHEPMAHPEPRREPHPALQHLTHDRFAHPPVTRRS